MAANKAIHIAWAMGVRK